MNMINCFMTSRYMPLSVVELTGIRKQFAGAMFRGFVDGMNGKRDFATPEVALGYDLGFYWGEAQSKAKYVIH